VLEQDPVAGEQFPGVADGFAHAHGAERVRTARGIPRVAEPQPEHRLRHTTPSRPPHQNDRICAAGLITHHEA
jgi:hypothetical protein